MRQLNTDRHLGNMGFMINNRTQEIIGMAPVFDYNCSLIYDYSESGDIDIEQYVKSKYTKLGTNFISVAKYFMAGDILMDVSCIPGLNNFEREFSDIKLASLMGNIIKKQRDLILN